MAIEQFACVYCHGVFRIPRVTVVSLQTTSQHAQRQEYSGLQLIGFGTAEPSWSGAAEDVSGSFWGRLCTGLRSLFRGPRKVPRTKWVSPRREATSPTPRQMEYAMRLGVQIPDGTSRRELSALINAAEHSQPPTSKQLGYAKRLGISVPPSISRRDLSALVSAAEDADPLIQVRRRKREEEKARHRLELYGPELLKSEQQWLQLADEDCFAGFVYRHGKKVRHVVLRLSDAELDEDKPVLWIEGERAKIVRDTDLGHIIEAEGSVRIASTSILWCKVIRSFDWDDVDGFRVLIERLKRMADEHGS